MKTKLLVCILFSSLYLDYGASELDDKYLPDNFNEKYYYQHRACHTNFSETLICNHDCKARLIKLQLDYRNIPNPKLCDYQRNYSANLIYGITTKYSWGPITTILSHSFINETRKNGNLYRISIGYVDDNSCETIRGKTFLAVSEIPNLDDEICCTVDGLKRQTGVSEIIFSTIDKQSLQLLWTTQTKSQLIELFKNTSLGVCSGCAKYHYEPGLMEEKALHENFPIPEPETTRETQYYSEYTVNECESKLVAHILSIKEIMNGRLKDSCDAIQCQHISSHDNVIVKLHIEMLGLNNTKVVSDVEVKLIYFKSNRNNGSYTSTTIGYVTDGPKRLLGTAYLEFMDLPNPDPSACACDTGITKLSGSVQKLFARVDVQNLLSSVNLKDVIKQIRINKIADCIGCVTVAYRPGLVSSHLIAHRPSIVKEDEQAMDVITEMSLETNQTPNEQTLTQSSNIETN